MSPNVYVVRQHAYVYFAFGVGGVLFCVLPWTINELGDGIGGILGRTFLSLLGLVSIAVGLIGWKAARIGIVVDRNGIWCGGFAPIEKTLVPWSAMLGVRKVTWTSPEGEHEGVVIGLHEDAVHPGGQDFARTTRTEIERLVGDIEYSNPLLLGHDEWDWQPDAFVALASRYIEDSNARDELEEWRRDWTTPQGIA
jgi:hypothetical protein